VPLYVLQFECPSCDAEPSVLEQHPETAVDREVPWKMQYCPRCGEAVEDPAAHMVEEYEIRRHERRYISKEVE
jgi:transcription elongation factor Elf1